MTATPMTTAAFSRFKLMLAFSSEILLFLLLLLPSPRIAFVGPQRDRETLRRLNGALAALPRARGPASINIPVKNGRANYQSQLQTNSTPLVLWCHAVDARLLDVHRGGEPPVLPAEEIYFTHNGQKHSANLSKDNYNGTLVVDPVQIGHAGQWTCHIRTRDYGTVNGEISVYLRPVVFSNTFRIDDVHGDKFRFQASGVTILRREQAKLECPVYGMPKPDIVWRKGAMDVIPDERIQMENGTLIINNATYEDEGTYTCKAFNSIISKRSSGGDKRVQYSVSIERWLRVKNEFSWLLPLGIIVLTVTLLVIIIVFCELRKRRKEQKQLLGSANNNEEE